MLTIYSIPAFTDNYIWIIVDDNTKNAIVVDPGDAKPVLDFLQQHDYVLQAILVTHKHFDHSGGVEELLSCFPDIPVYANKIENMLHTTHFTFECEVIKIPHFPLEFKVFDIPAHTAGHVAYYAAPFLFCGDTLFTAGCGRLFEGTAAEMFSSLQKLMKLPDETQVYCGHEYTLSNIRFALQVEPNNDALKKRFSEAEKARSLNQPTVPSTLLLEKLTNPFLRCDNREIIDAVSKQANTKCETAVEVFQALREWKNNFR